MIDPDDEGDPVTVITIPESDRDSIKRAFGMGVDPMVEVEDRVTPTEDDVLMVEFDEFVADLVPDEFQEEEI